MIALAVAMVGLLLAITAVLVGIHRAARVSAEQKRPGWKRTAGSLF
jgi:hypothetical protein